jgi:photoactive yellow protein
MVASAVSVSGQHSWNGFAGLTLSDLESFNEAELDILPFGVVVLDRWGRVVRYNRAEARFSHVDRNEAIGRDYLREVLPYVAPGFANVVSGFTQSAEPGQIVRLQHTFQYRFGAQEADVVLFRSAERELDHLCIRRTRHWARAPGERVAIALSDSATVLPPSRTRPPSNPALRSTFAIGPALFQALHIAWEAVAPKGCAVFSMEWGYRWGRLVAVDIEAESLERHGCPASKLPWERALELLAEQLRWQGLGQLRADINPYDPSGTSTCMLHLESSVLAASAGRSTEPRCHLLVGYLRAALGHLLQRKLTVREVGCLSQGNPLCTFEVAPQESH